MLARRLLTLLLLFTPLISFAESETTSRGELRLEGRFFWDDKNDSTEDVGYGLASRLEVDNRWNKLQNRLQVFSRVDRQDPTRQRLNIEELYSQWIGDQWMWYAGFKTLNWSTAEAFHPTDVINSRNFDGPFENAEKLGELMAGFQYLSEYLNLSAFYMPTLARPQLPAQSNRLSFAPAGFNVGQLQFINNDGQVMQSDDFVEQWAMRAQIPIDNWEFNLYWVHHFDRTDFRVIRNNTTGQFIPVLNEVDHYAFAFQYVWDAWIFKSENAYRQFQETTTVSDFANSITRQDYGISSLALEYMWSHAGGSDTTFIVEFQEIYGVERQVAEVINPFQRDVLVGARHSFNDEDGKEIFIGLIADVERGRELLASASYTQRLSDVWKMKVGARYIDALPTSPGDLTGIRPLNTDHQLDLSLSRFF